MVWAQGWSRSRELSQSAQTRGLAVKERHRERRGRPSPPMVLSHVCAQASGAPGGGA